MSDPVTYVGGSLLIVLGCLVIYLAVSLVRVDRRLTREARRYAEPRTKVYAADFAGDTPDERLTEALEWAQTQATPPMIVMEDGVTHFRTVRVYNGVRLTTEGQR